MGLLYFQRVFSVSIVSTEHVDIIHHSHCVVKSCVFHSADLVPGISDQIVVQNVCRVNRRLANSDGDMLERLAVTRIVVMPAAGDVELATEGGATESVDLVRQRRHRLPGRGSWREDLAAGDGDARGSAGHN